MIFSRPKSFRGFLRQSAKSVPYLYKAMAVVLLIIGLYQIGSQYYVETTGIPVSLKVVDMVESKSSKSTSWAPEFQITEGKYQGRRYLGNTFLSPPTHQVGENVKGHFIVSSSFIRSDAMIQQIREFGYLMLVGSFLCFAFSYVPALYRHIKAKFNRT